MEIAIHVFVNLEHKEFHLCETCNEEAWEAHDEQRRAEEEGQEENLGICVSCEKEPAKITFMHLTNGNFELCIHCFQWADHERDYGQDFGKSTDDEEDSC
jgi:protein-arginine kinase activator protein McsA